MLDLNNDRFSNAEFEENRKEIDGTFCSGVVWNDSYESLSNDHGELEISIISSRDKELVEILYTIREEQ